MPKRSYDNWVPWLVLAGGFLVFVGWFIGVVLLWSSHTWKLRDKLMGTLLFPGGLVLALPLLGWTRDCDTSGGPGQPTVTHCGALEISFTPLRLLVTLVLVGVPILVAVHLELVRRASPSGDAHGGPER